MKPSPPASAFSGSVGKNALRKEDSVELQPLDLLLLILLLELLLRETRHRARRIGEKHERAARHRHAGRETIKRVRANAIDEAQSSHDKNARDAFQFHPHNCERISQRSGKIGVMSVVARYCAPLDPPVPIFAPIVRCTIFT